MNEQQHLDLAEMRWVQFVNNCIAWTDAMSALKRMSPPDRVITEENWEQVHAECVQAVQE